eukprot:7127466-Ditylum_brightwellii.AAC.1
MAKNHCYIYHNSLGYGLFNTNWAEFVKQAKAQNLQMTSEYNIRMPTKIQLVHCLGNIPPDDDANSSVSSNTLSITYVPCIVTEAFKDVGVSKNQQ